jgi:hypothetical protein
MIRIATLFLISLLTIGCTSPDPKQDDIVYSECNGINALKYKDWVAKSNINEKKKFINDLSLSLSGKAVLSEDVQAEGAAGNTNKIEIEDVVRGTFSGTGGVSDSEFNRERSYKVSQCTLRYLMESPHSSAEIKNTAATNMLELTKSYATYNQEEISKKKNQE